MGKNWSGLLVGGAAGGWLSGRSLNFGNGWRMAHDGIILFDTRAVTVTRYRYRGSKIPTPWDEWNTITAT